MPVRPVQNTFTTFTTSLPPVPAHPRFSTSTAASLRPSNGGSHPFAGPVHWVRAAAGQGDAAGRRGRFEGDRNRSG
eukprot:226719-Rhodomonas_salina.2